MPESFNINYIQQLNMKYLLHKIKHKPKDKYQLQRQKKLISGVDKHILKTFVIMLTELNASIAHSPIIFNSQHI